MNAEAKIERNEEASAFFSALSSSFKRRNKERKTTATVQYNNAHLLNAEEKAERKEGYPALNPMKQTHSFILHLFRNNEDKNGENFGGESLHFFLHLKV